MFVEGVPSDLESQIDPSIRNLIVIDDLRVAVCKDRESAVSDPLGESLVFCPKLAWCRLFSKPIFKSSNDFVYL